MIDITNSSGIIAIGNHSKPYNYYYGQSGRSGKFYPSGTIGGFDTEVNFIDQYSSIVSNTLQDLVDDTYNPIGSTSTSTAGTPPIDFYVEVSGNDISFIAAKNVVSGYAIGDLITIQGSDMGGSGSLVLRVTSLETDGFLIMIGGDSYQVKWYDILINETLPLSLSDAAILLAQFFAPIPPPPPAPNLTLKIANNTNFDIPAYTGSTDSDFTIEWGAQIASDSNHPRPWSIGSWNTAAHAVSIENGNLLYWIDGTIITTQNISSFDYIGNWTYFTVMRNADTIYFYINGIEATSITYTGAIPTQGYDLYLGSEGNDSIQNGLMSNFRWNSTAVYRVDFTPPSSPLTSIFGTKLLIFQGDSLPLEITDNSGLGNVVTNNTGVYSGDSPFPALEGSIQFGTV